MGKVATICNTGKEALDSVSFLVDKLRCEMSEQDELRRTVLWWAIYTRQLDVVK